MFDQGAKFKFSDQSQPAKITIEVGDYRVTMTGKLEPPEVNRYLKDDFDTSAYLSGHNLKDIGGEMFYRKNVNMHLKDPEGFKVERFRWSIPVEIRPRIEE